MWGAETDANLGREVGGGGASSAVRKEGPRTCMKEPGSSGEETGPDSTFREPGARPSCFSSFSSAGSAPRDFTMSLRGRSSRLRFPRPCMLFLHHAMAGLLCSREAPFRQQASRRQTGCRGPRSTCFGIRTLRPRSSTVFGHMTLKNPSSSLRLNLPL